MANKSRAVKFTQPRANPPICWLCDGKLYAGGRSYLLVYDKDAERPRACHHACAKAVGARAPS